MYKYIWLSFKITALTSSLTKAKAIGLASLVVLNIVAILFDYGLKFYGLKTTTITSYLMFLPSK